MALLAVAQPVVESLPGPVVHPHSFELLSNSRYSVHSGFTPDLPRQVLANVLWAMSRDLFQSGIKCGNVSYPAVPLDEGIIRMTLNARHDRRDLDETLDILHRIGEQYGMLGKSAEELKEWENWFTPS